MNAAYSITFRGVDLRVELQGRLVDSIQAGGVEILPLLSGMVTDEILDAVIDKIVAESARDRAESA